MVIIGSGFGGLWAAEALAKAPVDITLIGGTSHHLFQPLLYQVATGVLSEGEIAPATREILKNQPNATVLLGRVTGIESRGPDGHLAQSARHHGRRRTTAWSSPPARGSPTSATTNSPSSRRG